MQYAGPSYTRSCEERGKDVPKHLTRPNLSNNEEYYLSLALFCMTCLSIDGMSGMTRGFDWVNLMSKSKACGYQRHEISMCASYIEAPLSERMNEVLKMNQEKSKQAKKQLGIS